MPLILVVDRDERVPKRVRQALRSEGWTVTHVRDVTEALQSAGSEAPDLFLVSADLPSARNLLATFARRHGGPGTLALVAEAVAGGAPGAEPGLGEDASLARSFDDAELRTAVERILRTPDRPGRRDGDEPKLTSHDIFGDLVAEVERETGVPDPVPPAPVPGRAVAPAAGAGPVGKRRPMDDDIERKLEQTLSGVLGLSFGAKPGTARGPGGGLPAAPAPARSSAPRGASEDLDKLISDTLSGLDRSVSAERKRRPGPASEPARSQPVPGAPTAGRGAPPRAGKPDRPTFELADLEALMGRSKKAREATPPAGRSVPGAPQPAAEPASPEAPAERPPLPIGSLFAEAMQEVPEAGVDERSEAEPVAAPAGGAGKTFGQYHLLDRIGVGGMAEVWKARMRGVEGFQKTVAIKRILPHLTDSPDFVEMFVDEAKLAAQLNHANIIHIYDLGKLGDDYYIAMEYVEGENLRAILNRAREAAGPLPPAIALYVGARLASALDYAHRKRDFEDRELGLVHRDVSPQNVLVGYEGTIKLCDFGIVKAVSKSSHTQMGALKGKLQYMSPEQAWGRSVDGRSDIFAVGCLLFEMLTGRRLFVGESEMEVLEAVRECRVQAPSELQPGLDPAIDAVVLKALSRDPEDRFQTAGELERGLEEILASVRPTPGQGELAKFMAHLFDRIARPAAAGDALARPEPAPERAEAGVAAAAVGAPAAAQGGLERVLAPPEGSEPVPAPVAAVAPVREVEPEEGGRVGKGLLAAAIVVALVLGGLLVWYLLQRGAAEEVAEPVQTEAAPEPAAFAPGAGEAQDTVSADPKTAPADGAPESEAPADAPAGGADLTETIDRAMEEELARREELLRKQFEEEERRLQRQLEALEESARQEEERAKAVRSETRGTASEPADGERPPAEATPAPAPAPAPAAPPPVAEPPPMPAAAAAPAPPPSTASLPPLRPPVPEPKPPPREPAVREGDLVTMGAGVEPPKLVRFEKPGYPPIARRLRIQGVVVISVLVDETGNVLETRLVQSAGHDVGLDEAALGAARSARYEPATRHGVRVKMWTTLRIPFKL